MNDTGYGRRRMIVGICAVLVLWAFAAHATELPPDPNNAALLYYQALALWSDVRSSYVDAETVQEPNDTSNAKPDTGNPGTAQFMAALKQAELEQAEASRESSRKRMRGLTIELIETASRIPRCEWGIYHSKGWGLSVYGSLRRIALLLEDDAKALASSGDYRVALERCLTIRRFARHLGNETITLHNMSLAVDGVAFRGIRNVLNSMPPDAEVLAWLKGEPAMSQETPVSLVRALDIHLRRALQGLERSPETIARIRNRIVGEAVAMGGKAAAAEVRSITDTVLISEIRKEASSVFADFLDSVNRAVERNKPYDQTYMEIELSTYKLRVHDIVPFFDLTQVEITPDFYRIAVSHRIMMNATKAAIEIYLIRAKTGELPDVLPDGLPKDPYTCRDFGYEITDEGFALRCQGKQFQRERLRRMLEFKVRDQGQIE